MELIKITLLIFILSAAHYSKYINRYLFKYIKLNKLINLFLFKTFKNTALLIIVIVLIKLLINYWF